MKAVGVIIVIILNNAIINPMTMTIRFMIPRAWSEWQNSTDEQKEKQVNFMIDCFADSYTAPPAFPIAMHREKRELIKENSNEWS